MRGIDFVTTAFLIFGLSLMILAYTNKRLEQKPNQIFLMLAILMFLIWIALFIIGLGGPF